MPQRIANYDLIQKLGDGPNGPVHMAMDTVLNRMVAIKVLPNPGASVDDARGQRVGDLSPIRTACLGSIFGTSGANENPAYLCREYVAGVGLDRLLTACNPLPTPLATAVIWGVSNALHRLHDAGHAHGNVKLSNVFLRQSGGVKLVDPWMPMDTAPASQSPNFEQDATTLGRLAITLWTALPVSDPNALDQIPSLCRDAVEQCVLGSPGESAAAVALLELTTRQWLTDNDLTPQNALQEGVDQLSSVFLMANLGAQTARTTTTEPATEPPSPDTAPSNDVPLDNDGYLRLQRSPSATEADLSSDEPTETYSLHNDEMSDLMVAAATPTQPPPDVPDADTPEDPPATTSVTKEMLSEVATNILFRIQEWRDSTFVRILVLMIAVGALVFWLLPSPDSQKTDVQSPDNKSAMSTETAAGEDAQPLNELERAKLRADQEPNNGDAHLALAEAYFEAKKWTASREVLKQATRLLPQSARPAQLSIRLLLETNDIAEAVIQARAASKTHATDASIHMLLARALLEQGRTLDAAKSLEIAVQIDTRMSEAWTLLGGIHLNAKQYEKARIAYERAVEENPKNTAGYVGLGRSMLALGRADSAVDSLVAGLAVTNDDPELEYTAARILLFGNRLVEANQILERNKQKKPNDWRIDFSRALIRLRQQRYAEALSLSESMQVPDEYKGVLHFNTGIAQMQLGQYRKAMLSLNAAVEANPKRWESHCERAKLHHHLSRWKPARSGYEQTLTLNPSSVIARAMLETRLSSPVALLQLGLPCQTNVGLDIQDG